MAEPKLNKETCAALDCFPSLTEQLRESGYDLCDNEGVWSFCDDPPGRWAANFQPDEYGHQMVVISIHGNSNDTWGISYASTLCGQCRGTCYWSGVTKRQLDWDDHWPDLNAAVLKARTLVQQEDAANG